MPNYGVNDLNANPAIEEGDHMLANVLRMSVYDSTKDNIDQSYNSLDRDVQAWSHEENLAVRTCLDVLEATVNDIDEILAEVKVTEAELQVVLQDAFFKVEGTGPGDLARVRTLLQMHRAHHTKVANFLVKLKYQGVLPVEHKITELQYKSDVKRAQFKAHLEALNDYSEVMSGTFVERVLTEKWAGRNAADVQEAIHKRLWILIYGALILFIASILLVYLHLIPPSLTILVAHCLIALAGGNA